jgi:hypothetical protein
VTLAAGALENLSFLTVRVLAVVGGAVVGALVTSIVVWLAGKYWLRRPLPWGPKKLLRILGAIAGALLVASFLHLSGGGWGLFGGGGSGTGESGDRGGTAKADAPKETPSAAAALNNVPPGTERANVTVLGGALVKGQAYYRVEGERAATDLNGVREFVRRRQEQAGGRLAAVDILIFQDSLEEKTEPVKKLRELVVDAKLKPNIVLMPGDIPAP